MSDDLISRQEVKDMLKNHRVDFCTEKDYKTARACINAVPEKRTETHGVCLDAISRHAAIDICANAIDLWHGQLGEGALIAVRDKIKELPPAQQNLSEEYAKAVRNWLVNYQVNCADLAGRYTPYEVLGWIVSDWRKENGIW